MQQDAGAVPLIEDGSSRKREKAIQFSSLDYQGVATVKDSGLLKRALVQGVGHGKGFGCGLLLVRYLR